MNKISKWVFLIGIVLFQFCNSNEKSTTLDFLNKMRGEGIKYVLILPDAGCLTCIDAAELFVRENKDSFNNFILVFTGKISPKNISNRIGPNILDKPFAYFDSINAFRIDYEITIYPKIIYLDDELFTVKEISPYQPNGLDSLKLVMGL